MSNEEQMRADFESCEISMPASLTYGTDEYEAEFNWRLWKAASAKRDEERDSLSNMQDIAIEKLNQQVLELSAQVEVMRKFVEEENYNEHGGDYHDDGCDVCQLIALKPSAALLAHDNEVAAKALEEAAERVSGIEADFLRELAEERRNRK